MYLDDPLRNLDGTQRTAKRIITIDGWWSIGYLIDIQIWGKSWLAVYLPIKLRSAIV